MLKKFRFVDEVKQDVAQLKKKRFVLIFRQLMKIHHLLALLEVKNLKRYLNILFVA
jgi:hypothetical protein